MKSSGYRKNTKRLLASVTALLTVLSVIFPAARPAFAGNIFTADIGTEIQEDNTATYVIPQKNPDYLRFSSDGPFTLRLAGKGNPNSPEIHLEYSYDAKVWNTYSFTDIFNGETVSAAAGTVYFRGVDNERFGANDAENYHFFTWNITGEVKASGNIMTLLDYRIPPTSTTPYCFWRLFSGCWNLTAAPTLPATALAPHCYDSMFSLTSITAAPALPATDLADGCYTHMFNGCSELIEAPTLPSEKMKDECYWGMFRSCTALVNAPALPATELADNCYRNMFEGCTSLTKAPALPATALKIRCYHQMFGDCTALTEAPALAFDTAAPYACCEMFMNCSNLQVTETTEYPNWVLADFYDNYTWNEDMISGTKGTAQQIAEGKSYFAGVHHHSWSYQLKSGTTDTLKAVCIGGGHCDYSGTDTELTISVNNQAYNSQALSASLSADSLVALTTLPSITYQALDKNGAAGEALAAAPANAGQYRASITVGSVTAYSDFVITPKDLNIEGTTAKSKVYDGSCNAEATLGEVNGIVPGDDVTVTVASALFADAEAGEGKIVNIAYSVKGRDAANYKVPESSTTTAAIFAAVASIEKDGKAVNYQSVQNAINAAAAHDTVTLLADAKENVEIPAQKTVTLDLNGNTLKGLGNNCVILVYGNLTLQDSSETATGKITGGTGYNTGSKQGSVGGGIYVAAGSLCLEGGRITGNRADFGGGVACSGKPDVHITVGGSAVISGNTRMDGTTADNLYLSANANSVTICKPFTANASIGITLEKGIGTVTAPTDGNYTAYFISDNSDFAVVCIGNNAERTVALITAKEAADKATAEAVIEKINTIGTVAYTDNSKAKIDEARAVYDALTADQKALIPESQAKVLTDSEAKYAALEAAAEKAAADKAAAEAVIEKINTIGTVAYTDNSKAKIDEARAVYDALTADQRALIPESQAKVLTDSEAEYAALEAAANAEPEEKTIWDTIRVVLAFLWEFFLKCVIPVAKIILSALL